ncbi:MAG: hypothetical protein K0U84_18285 [Actinomycetia bacterium]|nr:hypothetical protein [Actinomycetes bacterium]
MTVTVGHLAPRGCWDENALHQLLTNQLHPTGIDFHHVDGYPQKVPGAILIIPGQYWHERVDDINDAASRYEWLLCMKTGDEEDLFNIERIVHPNVRHWVQTPRTDRTYRGARLFGVGWTPAFNEPAWGHRPLDVFLSAQNTHKRRTQCFIQLVDNLDPEVKAVVQQTEGFTQGMNPDEYAKHMCAAKVAPCPSGTFSPDSFRVWEALQAHTVPIADDVSPRPDYYSSGYWRKLLPDCPFPIITDYRDLPGYVDDQLKLWPANANRITAWWMRYKREWSRWLRTDLEALGAL